MSDWESKCAERLLLLMFLLLILIVDVEVEDLVDKDDVCELLLLQLIVGEVDVEVGVGVLVANLVFLDFSSSEEEEEDAVVLRVVAFPVGLLTIGSALPLLPTRVHVVNAEVASTARGTSTVCVVVSDAVLVLVLALAVDVVADVV